MLAVVVASQESQLQLVAQFPKLRPRSLTFFPPFGYKMLVEFSYLIDLFY
jgi:hypothetical protein